MRLKLIWAEARGRAIGRSGRMPWHLPEDLAHFQRLTFGAPVIMGRRTWESLPRGSRPLSGRTNVVVSRNRDFFGSGAETAIGLQAALAHLVVAGTSRWTTNTSKLCTLTAARHSASHISRRGR